jgi:hypothetical protein
MVFGLRRFVLYANTQRSHSGQSGVHASEEGRSSRFSRCRT